MSKELRIVLGIAMFFLAYFILFGSCELRIDFVPM